MTHDDKAEFAALLSAVYDLHRAAFSETVIAIWWAALERYSLPAVREALSRHVQNPDEGRFLPKPADVVRELQGTRADASLAAWIRVSDAVRRVGSWVSVDFCDAIIHRVIDDLGGWIALGAATDADWPHVEKRFRDRFRMYIERRGGGWVDGPVIPHLPGLAEVANAARGIPSQPPLRLEPPRRREMIAVEVVYGTEHDHPKLGSEP